MDAIAVLMLGAVSKALSILGLAARGVIHPGVRSLGLSHARAMREED